MTIEQRMLVSPRTQAGGGETDVTPKQFANAIAAAVDTLESEPDQLIRARNAAKLIQLAHDAQEEFGEQRSLAFSALREMDWSLGDLAAEFHLSRARAAQIAVRERYKSGESRGGGGNPKRG